MEKKLREEFQWEDFIFLCTVCEQEVRKIPGRDWEDGATVCDTCDNDDFTGTLKTFRARRENKTTYYRLIKGVDKS